MKIACQHCGQKYDVENVSTGEEVECSACGKTFSIVASAAPAAPQPRHAGLFMCPVCRSEISRKAERCPHCGDLVDRSTYETIGEAFGRMMRYNISPIIGGILFFFALVTGFLWLGSRDDIMTLVGSFWFLLAAIFFKLK